MIIVSKEPDYYDCGVGACGLDKTIVYNRTISKFTKSHLPVGFPLYDRMVDVKYFIIGFCGKTYCLIHHYKRLSSCNSYFFYSYEEYLKFLKMENPKKNKWINKYYMTLEDFFATYHNKENLDIFVEYDTPIFVMDVNHSRSTQNLTINQNLQKFDFKQIFNPVEAFSRIAQFLTNELAKEKSIPVASDKVKQKAHDMDKWSFRNPNTPKRKQKQLTTH